MAIEDHPSVARLRVPGPGVRSLGDVERSGRPESVNAGLLTRVDEAWRPKTPGMRVEAGPGERSVARSGRFEVPNPACAATRDPRTTSEAQSRSRDATMPPTRRRAAPAAAQTHRGGGGPHGGRSRGDVEGGGPGREGRARGAARATRTQREGGRARARGERLRADRRVHPVPRRCGETSRCHSQRVVRRRAMGALFSKCVGPPRSPLSPLRPGRRRRCGRGCGGRARAGESRGAARGRGGHARAREATCPRFPRAALSRSPPLPGGGHGSIHA